MLRDYASVTQDTFHVYADSTRPDDTGSGLTLATAKKTVEAAVGVLPNIAEGHVVLHLTGSFTLTENILINTNMQRYKRLVVDGGDSITVLEGPYSATSGTVSTLTDSARSWTINEWQGCTLEVLDGARIGYRTTIQSNTADTLTIVQNLPSAITTDSYRITRPATTLTSSGVAWFYYGGNSEYDVVFQRLRFTGNTLVGMANSSRCNLLRISDVTYEGGYYFSVFNGGLSLTKWTYDPSNPDSAIDGTKNRVGVSYLGTNARAITISGVGSGFVQYSTLIGELAMFLSTVAIYSGSLLKSILVTIGSKATVNSSSGFVSTKVAGSSGVGISAVDSIVITDSGIIDISNCATHGIEISNTRFDVSAGGISGGGNGNLGLYAHDGSVVKIAGATPPTVTGTDGDVAVTIDDLETPLTWSEIVAAGGVSSAQEATIIKVS